MGRVFRISQEKKNELIQWYKYFGCTDYYATAFADIVFNHQLSGEEVEQPVQGWEIDYQKPKSKPKAVKKHKSNMFNGWMKGGWNRVGTWENEYVASSFVKSNENVGRQHMMEHLSYEYIEYMQKCQRFIDYSQIQASDVLKMLSAEIGVMSSQLPLTVTAWKYGKYLCIDALATNKEPQSLKGKNHIFVIDLSGSMYARWVMVQLTMTALYNSLDDEDNITILAFSKELQVVVDRMPAKNNELFLNALKKIRALGGSFEDKPVLQMAFGMQHIFENPGKIVLFTDEAIHSNFKSNLVCNEYIKAHFLQGNEMIILAYGTEACCDEALYNLAITSGVRIQSILEPINIKRILEEHWMDTGITIENLQLSIETDACSYKNILPISRDINTYTKFTDGTVFHWLFNVGESAAHKPIQVIFTYINDEVEKTEKMNLLVSEANKLQKKAIQKMEMLQNKSLE